MTDENQAAQEQHNETSTEVAPEVTDQTDGNTEGEAAEEFDIVLAGQDEPQESSTNRSGKDYILDRVMRRKDKLQDENVRLRQQVGQQQAPQAPQAPAVQAMPNEFDYEDRNQYLQASAQWQSQLIGDAVNKQLNHQQNGHRVAAQEQEQTQALESYAKSASKLNISDFNDVQDKAFNVLGDEFAQVIATQIPNKDEAAKLMYFFGKNPRDAEAYRDKFQHNPGQTTYSLGALAAKLTVKSKRSNAAQPETKVDGASVGGGMSDWQKQYSQIMDGAKTDNMSQTLRQMRELKKKAAADGYDVSTLK